MTICHTQPLTPTGELCSLRGMIAVLLLHFFHHEPELWRPVFLALGCAFDVYGHFERLRVRLHDSGDMREDSVGLCLLLLRLPTAAKDVVKSCAECTDHLDIVHFQLVDVMLRRLEPFALLGHHFVGVRQVPGNQQIVLGLGILHVLVELAASGRVLAAQRCKGALDRRVRAHLLVVGEGGQLEVVATLERTGALLRRDDASEDRRGNSSNSGACRVP